MGTVEEFVILYHSIEGVTVKEKRKHFNKFISSLQAHIQAEEDLNKFVNSLTPKTPLEEAFRIDLIIKLQRKCIILEELKKCNYVLVQKLLRNWRLFDEIFSNITVNELVNSIFSHLSYSLKFKILTGISKNVKNDILLDEYFEALEKKYGLKIATYILPGCSIDLIKSTVAKYHLKLTNSHLKSIFKKDKQFIDFYFEVIKRKYENIDFSNDYKYTLKYVAKVDPKLYWQICDKFGIRIKFGKRMTPSMIKSHAGFLQKGHNVFDIFHLLQMYKTIKREGNLKEFLLNLYPQTHHEFSKACLEGSLFRFIEKGPFTVRYNLLSEVFTQKYHKNLLDYEKYFTEDLLKITPIEERTEILKLKDEEDLVYLYNTAVSVPKYKEKLQHTSNAKARCEIAARLYETCAVNRDKDALLEVLKYILIRYKNDTYFLITFYNKTKRWPNVFDLSEEHWQHLANIVKIIELAKVHHFYAESFYERYVIYLLKNGKSCYEMVKERVKEIVEDEQSAFHHVEGTKYQRAYWNEVAKCIDEYRDNEKYQTLCSVLLYRIAYDSSKSKRISSISDYRYMFDQLKCYNFDSIFLAMKCIAVDDAKIHDLFWKSEYIDDRCLLWYAKHRPEILKENMDRIFIKIDTYRPKLHFRKLHNYLDIESIEKIKNYTLDNIRKEDCVKAEFPLRALSILAPETFLEITSTFVPPSDGKIDLEQLKNKVNLQKVIVKSLANIEDSSQSFPIILKFCVTSDYLKFALCSLYKTMYNSPEMHIKSLLNQFSNRAVSVRKHVLNFGRHLLTSNEFYKLIQEWSIAEKNLSIKNIIVKKTIEYLCENPSEHFWNLLNNNFKLIVNTNDRKLYDVLIKFKRIPLNYQPEYLKTIYELISDNSDVEIRKKKFQLIDEIPTVLMDKLDGTFIKEVIRQTVCKAPKNKFHWKCVFFTTGEKQLELFTENINVFKAFLDENYRDTILDVKIRSQITNFLMEFYTLSLEIRQCGYLIEKFLTLWSFLFKPENFGKELMLIQFTNLYFLSEFKAYETGLKINVLLYDYIAKYNKSVIHSFSQQLCSFLNTARIEGKELYNFMDGLFQHRRDENIYIPVMYLLPKTIPTHDNIYEDYVPILKAIENCDSSPVRHYFDFYLTNGGLE